MLLCQPFILQREGDQVILIDFFEEAMPGKPQPERIGYDPEEAKRLFYVAITRAIHRLDILSVEAYHGNSEEVSSFVRDYACVCDEICEVPATQRKHTSSILSGCLSSSVCAIEPLKYYGVPVGKQSGIYTTWAEAKAQTDGVSIAPEKQAKSFIGGVEIERVIP